MANSYEITFEGDYVKVLSNGDKDLEFATNLWSAIAETCHTHNCFDVLGIAETSSPVSIWEGSQHAQLFRDLGIIRNYRIAWVELNPQARRATYFIETVLFNRGLPGRLFSTVTEAKEGLFSKRDA